MENPVGNASQVVCSEEHGPGARAGEDSFLSVENRAVSRRSCTPVHDDQQENIRSGSAVWTSTGLFTFFLQVVQLVPRVSNAWFGRGSEGAQIRDGRSLGS